MFGSCSYSQLPGNIFISLCYRLKGVSSTDRSLNYDTSDKSSGSTGHGGKIILGLAALLVVSLLLEWVSVRGASATGIDSTYGLVILACAGVVSWHVVSRGAGKRTGLLATIGGLVSLGMIGVYFDSLEGPQEEPPYLVAYLPDGSTGPMNSLELEPGIFLAGAAGAGLFLAGIATYVRS